MHNLLELASPLFVGLRESIRTFFGEIFGDIRRAENIPDRAWQISAETPSLRRRVTRGALVAAYMTSRTLLLLSSVAVDSLLLDKKKRLKK